MPYLVEKSRVSTIDFSPIRVWLVFKVEVERGHFGWTASVFVETNLVTFLFRPFPYNWRWLLARFRCCGSGVHDVEKVKVTSQVGIRAYSETE